MTGRGGAQALWKAIVFVSTPDSTGLEPNRISIELRIKGPMETSPGPTSTRTLRMEEERKRPVPAETKELTMRLVCFHA